MSLPKSCLAASKCSVEGLGQGLVLDLEIAPHLGHVVAARARLARVGRICRAGPGGSCPRRPWSGRARRRGAAGSRRGALRGRVALEGPEVGLGRLLLVVGQVGDLVDDLVVRSCEDVDLGHQLVVGCRRRRRSTACTASLSGWTLRVTGLSEADLRLRVTPGMTSGDRVARPGHLDAVHGDHRVLGRRNGLEGPEAARLGRVVDSRLEHLEAPRRVAHAEAQGRDRRSVAVELNARASGRPRRPRGRAGPWRMPSGPMTLAIERSSTRGGPAEAIHSGRPEAEGAPVTVMPS